MIWNIINIYNLGHKTTNSEHLSISKLNTYYKILSHSIKVKLNSQKHLKVSRKKDNQAKWWSKELDKSFPKFMRRDQKGILIRLKIVEECKQKMEELIYLREKPKTLIC